MAYAGAVTLPTSEVVAAADSSSAMYNVLRAAPTGDTNHVLCRGHDEPLGDFGKRVEWRLRALRRKSSVTKLCYLLGPHSPQDWLPCRQALITLVGLLSSGAEFELVTAPTLSIDVLRTLEELMLHAKVGVRVSIRREDPLTADAGVDDISNNRSVFGAGEAHQLSEPLPGLASAARSNSESAAAALWS